MKGEELKREIGTTDLALAIINLSIGAGIYVLPALIGIQLGPASLVGYVLIGIMFLAIVLCYVEVGSVIKSSGGSYAYVEAAFGKLPGFIVNWLFFFGFSILSDAAIMNIVADSLAVLFPVFLEPIMRVLLIAALVGLMIFINVRKVRTSIRIVRFTTMIKLIPLLLVILLGCGLVEPANLTKGQWPSMNSFNETLIILFFLFAGFESALNISGEVKNPKRTIPRALMIGGLVVFSMYLITHIVMQGVLGEQMTNFKDAPMAAIAERVFGAPGATLILVATAVSILGAINGDILSSPRLLYAGSRDKLFPAYLGRLHSRFATPWLAVITFGSLIFIFSVTGGFKQLAILASGALLLVYLGVILSMIKLRLKNEKGQSFRTPGGFVVPIFAIIAILYVLANLSRMEIFSIAVFILAVCILYFVMKKPFG